MSEYQWRLTWQNYKDTPCLRAAAEHLNKEFPLYGDSKCRLIDHAEYTKLVEAGEIAPPKDYWQVSEDHIGLISLTGYKSHTTTWDRLNQAKADFMEGWRQAKNS